MEATILNKKNRDSWNSYIEKNPHSIAWQIYEWSELVEKHYKSQFYPLAVIDQNEIRGILPLYKIKTFGGKERLLSVPHAVAGGILADSTEYSKSLLEKAIKIAGQSGSLPITLKQYKTKIEGDLRIDDNYYNKELDLSGGAESVWNRISDHNRQMINLTNDKKFSILYPSDEIDTFYKLLLRHNRNRGVPAVGKAWINDLVENGMYRMALIKSGERFAGGTLVKTYKNTISFPFTCTPDNLSTLPLPIYRLYWELISSFSNQGLEIFHSGRIPNTDDTDEYRLGWGGVKFGYFYQYHPHTLTSTEFSKKRNKKRLLFERLWKVTPLPITRFAGPFIVKQFP